MTTTFNDSQGTTWNVEITIDTLRRVRAHMDVDLGDLTAGDPPLLTQIETDIVMLINIVYLCVKPQLDAAGIDDETFAARLGGEAAQAAHDAFWQALELFFQSLHRTEQVRAIAMQLQLIEKIVAAGEARMTGIDLDKIVDQAFSDLPTNLPASSASTPEGAPSAS